MAYQYDPNDKFGYKDTLPEGHAEKIIKGSEFDDEFNKISAESFQTNQDLTELNAKLDAEIEDRKAGDEILQNQIDEILLNGGGSGGGGTTAVKWVDVKQKPASIEKLGLQNIITGGSF